MVNVTAAVDLIDSGTGDIEVPATTPGVVQQTTGPVSELRLQVTFSPSTGPVTRWVVPSEVLFEDGKLGLARAYYIGRTLSVDDLRYSGTSADFTGRLGEGKIMTAGVVEFAFGDGTVLRLRNNRNSGDLDIEMY